MSPERYRQVNALADAALQMTPEQRDVFLNEVCGSDRELRQQIDALLDADSRSSGFLQKPLLEVLAADLAERPAQRDLTGCRIAHYEVLSRLGAGGIGEVWLARDLNLDRQLALKLLSPRFSGDPYHVRRFEQEARTASALNHPNIITVYEIGRTENALFIAEERVVGETIRQRMARGPMPLREILDIAMQAAAALGAAHAAGIVHRDIKPENVMVRPEGLVKILDFGLARFVERPPNELVLPSESLSLPGLVLGTVRYMSPEQARGLTVDGRSDLFSLGVMLYEMAAGLPPFSGTTPTDTLAAILTSDPAPMSRYSRDAPAEFERIVRRCLAKDPTGRYPSAAALKDDLARLAGSLDIPARPRNRRRLAAAAAALVAALTGVYFLAARKDPAASFHAMSINRVATQRQPADAAISPDGKLLAYIVEERSGQSVWIRNVSGTGEKALVPAGEGEHSGVVFSPEDAFLYYRLRRAEDIGELYRVPVQGGAAQRVAGEVSGAAAVSPDGKSVAFVRLNPSSWESSLVVTDAAGSRESIVATLRRPRYFDLHSVAWSPDGKSIACFSGDATRYSEAKYRLVEVRLGDRSQRAISEQPWRWPRSVAWSPVGDVLIVAAPGHGDDINQLWTVRRDNGAVARLTNDLSSYDRVTVTNDGKSLATVQSDTTAAVWVAGEGGRFASISAVPLHSTRINVAWTPDGRILYSDFTGAYRNLWLTAPDGSNRKRLASGPHNQDQAAISGDGRYIVYKQDGNIWRMDAGGAHAQQLTHGSLDVHPDVSPDGRTVVYGSFANWSPSIGGEPTLWRVPIDGGEAMQISRQPASYPRVSPDGKRLGCVYFPGKDPRFSAGLLALLGLDGSGGFQVFESSTSDETQLSWSPDGKGLDYIGNAGGVGNIWRQPANGGQAKQITKFESSEIYAFSWSRDGRLACVRGTTARDLVLIEGFR